MLDPAGIPVSTAPGWQDKPALASDGTGFFVVWDDQREPPPNNYRHVYGARISNDGSVLDPSGIPIAVDTNEQFEPAIAWNGASYLVSWTDTRSLQTEDVYAARVSASGEVLSEAPIAAGGLNEDGSRLASDGTNTLAVWTTAPISGGPADVYGVLLDADGNPIGSPTPISAAPRDQKYLTVAWAADDYLVAWTDYRNDPEWGDIYGARLSREGAVLDPSGLAVAAAPEFQSLAAVAWDGSNFMAAWGDGRFRNGGDIFAARVTEQGQVLDPNGIVVTFVLNEQRDPAVAWNGSTDLALWSDERNPSDPDVFGARLTPSGSMLDGSGFAVSTATRTQGQPAVAWNGSLYLVAWSDDRNDTPSVEDIYVARVTADGTVLDPDGIQVTSDPGIEGQPAVTWDGAHFLVVWSSSTAEPDVDIDGARIDPDGTVLDPGGFPIAATADNESDPDVVSNGTTSLVVWRRSYELFGARVAQSGAVVDPGGIPIAQTGFLQQQPAVASNGEDFFVVWKDASDIKGARVDASGTVVDPNGIVISGVTGIQSSPDVEWNGMRYLAAWRTIEAGAPISSVGGSESMEACSMVLPASSLRLRARTRLPRRSHGSRVPKSVSPTTEP